MDTDVDANDSAPEIELAAHEARSLPRRGLFCSVFPHCMDHMFQRGSHVIFDEYVWIISQSLKPSIFCAITGRGISRVSGYAAEFGRLLVLPPPQVTRLDF